MLCRVTHFTAGHPRGWFACGPLRHVCLRPLAQKLKNQGVKLVRLFHHRTIATPLHCVQRPMLHEPDFPFPSRHRRHPVMPAPHHQHRTVNFGENAPDIVIPCRFQCTGDVDESFSV